ncbi:protein SPMIP7 [Ascaphus truei]|uniref:protein SPMIP7 n=1 Tax=Ascaphus truei TaxID=8439 RepID=UPI003F592AA4
MPSNMGPQSLAPSMTGYCVHPHRDNVPLLDPCSGFVSSGADADLRPGTGKTIPSLVDQSYVKPQNTDPWLGRVRSRTALPKRAVILHPQQKRMPAKEAVVMSQESMQEVKDLLIHQGGRSWNSVARSDASRRAMLGGWTSKMKVIPQLTRGPSTTLTHKFIFNVDPALKHSSDASYINRRDETARKFMYTSSTQRAYEEVPWDIKLPAKVMPPDSTLENMPDPISQHFTLKRNESQPEPWQVAGGMWDRFQTRILHTVNKPVTFVSPFPHMDHIPRYSGCTGSVNIEDVDNHTAHFIPFTKVRTSQPRYTNTAQ